jgi:DNA polymerase II large subunit
MSKYSSSPLWKLFQKNPYNRATTLRRLREQNASYRRRGISLPFTTNRNRLRLRELTTRRNNNVPSTNVNSLANLFGAMTLGKNKTSRRKEELSTLEEVAKVKEEKDKLRIIKKVEEELKEKKNETNLEKKEAAKLEAAKKKAEAAKKRAEAAIKKAEEALAKKKEKVKLLEEAASRNNLSANTLTELLAPPPPTRKSARIASRRKKANNNSNNK